MQSRDYVGRDQGTKEVGLAEMEFVRVELPWVPLVGGDRPFLTQVVLRDHARAVEDAIDLYMRCRVQPHFDVPLRGQLTLQLWRVLQSAHPHAFYQWGDWAQAYQQFSEMAREFLGKVKAA